MYTGHNGRNTLEYQTQGIMGTIAWDAYKVSWAKYPGAYIDCYGHNLLECYMQGIMGTIPWNALVFLTLYMQLLGMSDAEASTLMSLFLGACALGGLLGGVIGDKAAARYPFHGRIAVTQFSVFTGIPMSWIIVKVTTVTPYCQGDNCDPTHITVTA